MSLRAYLLLLAFAALLPLAIFAGVVGVLLVDSQRDTFRRGAEERTLAVLTAVEVELNSSISTAEALAVSPALDQPDFEGFREIAASVLSTQRDWSTINVALPSGQQVMNLSLERGTPLPAIPAGDSSIARAVETQRPALGDMVFGPTTQQWDFAVRVPIVRDGEVKYILSAVVKPSTIYDVLKAQNLPADWVAVVIDRNHRVVARTLNPEKTLAELASQSLRDALSRAPSGWFHGTTMEGTEVYTPYRRSESTGWAFAMGIPAYVVNRAGERARILLGVGLIIALGLALALALLVGRRIAQPITALADATKAMGHGEPLQLPEHDVPVSEVRTLNTALREAALAIDERQSLIQREKTALQAADRSKDEFLAMLSHELRTPLAALTTAAHVLRVAGADQHRAAQARGVIERQARHMARLLEDLLDVSRISLGKAQLQRESFDLADVVEQLVAAWQASGRFEHHGFAHATAPVWVLADRTRIEQVVSNLLDNALKFTARGRGVTLTLRQAGTEALLQVADEGQGLSGEAMTRVFDPFVQGEEQGLDPHKSGMGIGLALVKQLTEMHGGSVTVTSRGPGTGTVFTVRLPAMLRPHAQPVGRPASGEGTGSRHILIIEDNDDTRTMLREALALIGHEVREAADGAAGLAAAHAAPPDIALIDIGLPDMDGYEVARRIREHSPNGRIPLIALSGYGQPADVKRAYDAGFDAHLTKPVAIEELHGALRAFR